MTKETKNNPFTVKVQADKPVIPAGKAGARILEISLTAPPAPDDKPHIPLNLSLVLDKSGSMHGDKLRYVKEAAAHVIDLMSEQDRAAVVVYDDKVQTLMPSQLLTDQAKKALKEKIMGIESGASTFLYGGWLTGCRQVAESVSDDSFNRTLLLTDGLANVGVRDVGALSVHAQELFMRGISTSCFGVGRNYDEHLLESMANHGGGSFHFLETLNAIPLVFEREFDEIISITLKEVKITLTLPASVTASVSANWHSKREGDQLTLFMGSLAADQEQSLYLQLSNLEGDCEIPILVSGKDSDQVEHQIKTAIVFKALPSQEESAIPQDPALMARFAVVDLAAKANDALKRERAGDRMGSSQMMRNSISQHQDNISKDTFDKYQTFSDEMGAGLDSLQRKRRHQMEYDLRRGYQSIRDYRFDVGMGGMTADIEEQTVLINTASPVSLGWREDWRFLDAHHQLQLAFNQMDLEEVSDMLGKRVDVMLGMDILKDMYVRLDPGRRVIQFSRQPLRSRGWRIRLTEVDGIPACTLRIGSEEVEMRLVTGLQNNYVPEEILGVAASLGEAEDVFLGLGAFTTGLYKLPLQLGRETLSLTCGRLPDVLKGRLALGEREGVLGAAFLQIMPATLAFPEGKLVMLT